MDSLQIFNSSEFGTIRTAEIDGEVWFVGKDVAVALGYSNPQKAIRDHVDAEDMTVNESFTVNGTAVTLINESGVYSLILSSKLPNAKKFKHWITSEVIPSIRKTGGYIAGQEQLTDSELMAKAVLVAQKTIAARDEQIAQLTAQQEVDRPKVIFADSVAASKTSILIGELAKILKQNGVDMGQNRLFDWMRQKGFLIRRQGNDFNMPTQRAMEMGLFEIKETSVSHSDGHVTVNKTPKVTGKGQQYFINLFLGGKKKEA